MNGGRAYQQYRKTQVQTARQENLIIMLYQGAVKFLFQAERAMQDEDHEQANNHLLRVQEIVNELRFSLDIEGGGELAGNLYALYDFMYRSLVRANLRKDHGPIREVRGLMSELLTTWREANERVDPEEIARAEKEFRKRKAEAQRAARERGDQVGGADGEAPASPGDDGDREPALERAPSGPEEIPSEGGDGGADASRLIARFGHPEGAGKREDGRLDFGEKDGRGGRERSSLDITIGE